MNLPTLPDNLFKLMLVIGGLLFVYVMYTYDNNIKYYQEERIKDIDNLTKDKVSNLIDSFNEKNRVEAINLKLKNEGIGDKIQIIDSHGHYRFNLSQLKVVPKWFKDTMQNFVNYYDTRIKENQIMVTKEIGDIEKFKVRKDGFKSNSILLLVAAFFSIIFIAIGWAGWAMLENRNEIILRGNNIAALNYSSYCKSCGLYFDAITNRGSNVDNSPSQCFCGECYNLGQFVDPGININQMATKVRNKLSHYRTAPDVSKVLKKLKKLDRWKGPMF